MQNKILNKKGMSLIEILAILTLSSLFLLLISNILSQNVKLNGINQEKTINANIANSALNYVKSFDFDMINNEMSKVYDENKSYLMIDNRTCNETDSQFVNDPLCEAVLEPIINNRQYDFNNLVVFIIPYNDETKYTSLLETDPNNPIIQIPILNKHIESIETTNEPNEDILRIIVIVRSSINEKYDYLLEGVITNE